MEYQTMRALLVIYLIAAIGLTISYLRYRRCSALECILWGALAIAVPVLGPFFVIAARPGPRKRFSRPNPGKQVFTNIFERLR